MVKKSCNSVEKSLEKCQSLLKKIQPFRNPQKKHLLAVMMHQNQLLAFQIQNLTKNPTLPQFFLSLHLFLVTRPTLRLWYLLPHTTCADWLLLFQYCRLCPSILDTFQTAGQPDQGHLQERGQAYGVEGCGGDGGGTTIKQS